MRVRCIRFIQHQWPMPIGHWRQSANGHLPYRVLMSKPDFAEPLAPRNLAIFDDALEHYGALDSLYENDMLESVPVAPGEQSNYQQAIAARRAYDYEQAMAARRRYKRKQYERATASSRGSAAVAVASWRRVR